MSIKDIAMFKGLSNMVLAKLLGNLEKHTLPIGATLFAKGDFGDKMYIIEEGMIDLYSSSSEGSQQLLATLREGAAFGEMALLTGEARSATAIARTDTSLFVINQQVLDGLITEHSVISAYFIRLLSQRLISTNNNLHDSKESESQWILHQLAKMPASIKHFLYWCSAFPFVSKELTQHSLGISIEDSLAGIPGLKLFLHADPEHPELVSINPELRQTLRELGIANYGYQELNVWHHKALEFYKSKKQWPYLISLYIENKDWDSVLELITGIISEINKHQQQEIMSALWECPKDLFAKHPAVLECYLCHCKEANDDQVDVLMKPTLTTSKSITPAKNPARLQKPLRTRELIGIVSAIVCIIFFYSIEPVAGLSTKGMQFIGIAIAAVILWIIDIIPDYIVALGMVMLWVLSGIVTPEFALAGFASTTWLFMIFIMAFSAVMTKSGILYRFSLYALKRFPSNYRGQLWGIIAAGMIMNPLIPSSNAKVSLGVPISRVLAEAMGIPEKSKGAAGLGLTAMIFYGFTSSFVLTGSYTNILAYGLVSTGEPITWLQWFYYALPGSLIFCAVMAFMLAKMFQHSSSTQKKVSPEVLNEQIQLLGPLSNVERLSICTIVSCILLMILHPLHGLDNTWIMLLGFSFLVISGVLDRQTITSEIDWTFLLFLGVVFSFASVGHELGIPDVMSNFLREPMSWFQSSPYIFLTAVLGLSFLVTLVIRDDPAVILLVTALLPLGRDAGIHPWILVFVILLATDPFFFSYQSPTYLTAYYSSEGKAFTHQQGQRVAFAYALTVLLLILISIPYWTLIGLIN